MDPKETNDIHISGTDCKDIDSSNISENFDNDINNKLDNINNKLGVLIQIQLHAQFQFNYIVYKYDDERNGFIRCELNVNINMQNIKESFISLSSKKELVDIELIISNITDIFFGTQQFPILNKNEYESSHTLSIKTHNNINHLIFIDKDREQFVKLLKFYYGSLITPNI